MASPAKMPDFPLLAAIAAYNAGEQAPHWVQRYMPRSV